MNSSNQNKSESNIIYDPNAALEFFKLFGKLESAKAGEKFFVQRQKAGFLSFLYTDKMYLLVEGNVTIQTVSGNIINVEPGEVFGKFTPYTTSNATAIADTPCKLVSLDEKQFMASLKTKPAFLFMLMDVLIRYFQKTDAETKDAPLQAEYRNSGVLSTEMLNQLRQKLDDTALMAISEKRMVFHEGATALLMYVILEGYMTIVVDNKVVGRSGPGDIVGEIGLVAQRHARTANVITETRCLLLAIDRYKLLELIQTFPGFGISLLQILVSHLSIRRTTVK
jgi:CRP-like cAMP-binding protein